MNFLHLHLDFVWGVLAGSSLEFAHIAWLWYRRIHPPCRLSEVSVLEYVQSR
jgi:hypothetical protein